MSRVLGSGELSIVFELQGLLPRPFLAFGVDTLVASAAASVVNARACDRLWLRR
jgi:hypothetical protein